MLNSICNDAKLQMSKGLESYKKHLSAIRTGRAHISLLDDIKVDYYGVICQLSKAGIVQVVDARTLVVRPWDKSMLKAIEKSIFEANLGLSPVANGEIVRIPVPALNEERRKEYVKQAKQRNEEAKIIMRNIRRDANELLKKAIKDSRMSEDNRKRGLKMIQEITNQFSTNIDRLFDSKEKEIMVI